jgi:hypothetical protein
LINSERMPKWAAPTGSDLVAAAIREGRIPAASRTSWLTLLQTDPNAEQTLRSLRRNTIPVAEIGHAGDPELRLYEELFRDR